MATTAPQAQPAPPADAATRRQLLDAILILEAEPTSIAKLTRLTGLTAAVVKATLDQLREEYARVSRGVQLIELAGGFALVPKAALWPWLRANYGKLAGGKLSRAALETLSIVAYSQPITRSEIESIRGVSPDGMLRTLLERSLIQEVGRKDAPGRPTLFGTSREFLRTFGLATIADLPRLDPTDQAKFGGQAAGAGADPTNGQLAEAEIPSETGKG